MEDIARCAACGENRELCQSARVDGIKQPRICKECLSEYMRTGESKVEDLHWIIQLNQLDDGESIENLRKQLDEESLIGEGK
uniref:Uncharacterized protein n=1 Tax=viral metagenome TaxID=1070528 RepID=A0A6M3K5P4_9ZZZZ